MMELLRRMGPVTKNLLILNVLIWAFCALTPASTSARLIDTCALHYFSSPGFRVWQLFTYMFVHVEFWHLLCNMFALVMFGTFIEWAIGRERYIFYYLSCGVGAALIQEGVFAIMISKLQAGFSPEDCRLIINSGWQVMQGSNMIEMKALTLFADPSAIELARLVNGPVIGASGAIFGILLAYAMLWPNRELYIMFIPVPVKAKWVIVGYTVLELFMGIGGVDDGVAHFAHLGGMAVGFVIIYIWNKRHTFSGWY